MNRTERRQEKIFKKMKVDFLKLKTRKEKQSFRHKFFKLKGMSEDTLSNGWDYITL